MCCEVEMFLSSFSFFLSRHLICIYDLLAHKYLTFLTFGFFKKKMTWSTFVVCYLYLLGIKIIFKKSILFGSLTKSDKTFFKFI